MTHIVTMYGRKYLCTRFGKVLLVSLRALPGSYNVIWVPRHHAAVTSLQVRT